MLCLFLWFWVVIHWVAKENIGLLKMIYEMLQFIKLQGVKRFDRLMKCLHFNDNENLNKNDKYSKLGPLLDHLQETFMQRFVPSQMVPR